MKIEKEPYYERMNTLFKSPVVPERHQWRHKMLLTIFSRLSNDWDMTTMDEKIAIIRKIIASGESISMLLEEYKEYFSKKNEHIADVNTSDWALAEIMLSMSNRIWEPAESGESLDIKGYGAALAGIIERMTTLIPDPVESSDWVEVLCEWADKYEIPAEVLPRSQEKMREITDLNLIGYGLDSIPKELAKLENVKFLWLSENKLSAIPDEFGKHKKLEEIDLSKNRFTVFPKCICSLEQLITLWLMDNFIEDIPNSICNLRSLENLYLGYDSETNIPYINYSEKRLKKLPEKCAPLKNILQICIDDSEIEELPNWLLYCEKLETINISGTPAAKNCPDKFLKRFGSGLIR